MAQTPPSTRARAAKQNSQESFPLQTNPTHPFLRSLNLREGEGKRTFLMFGFYGSTSAGLVWLEACAVDLFLSQYGATNLPLIYLASSAFKIGLGLLYSWMQKFLPLRWVIVLIALLIALPLPIFWFGLQNGTAQMGGFYVVRSTVLLMQLWLEASHTLNELNTSITANQLFNVREVKRTFPLISSGSLVADVVSGFTLPIVLTVFPRGQGVPSVILMAGGLMFVGAMILTYLSQTHQQSFPDIHRRRDDAGSPSSTPRIRGRMRRYVSLLQAFFGLAQVFVLLVEFQFLNHLEQNASLSPIGGSGDIASFLGLFNGALGICELGMQSLFSSRIIDRLGVFASVMLLPIVIIVMSGVSMSGMIPVFIGVVGLRFLYELLHYTLFSAVGPVLFYSVPEHLRNREQARVRGLAEPVSTAVTGLTLFGWVNLHLQDVGAVGQNFSFGIMILLAIAWCVTIWLLKNQYVELLVLNAERGQLSSSEVDLRALRQKVIDTLEKPGVEADKRSCIELLSQIDPKNAADVLAPMLTKLSPVLQHKSLEAMLNYPNASHASAVTALLKEKLAPEVMAVALRYVWLTDSAPQIDQITRYLDAKTHPIVRGTAASLILRQGSPTEKAHATNTLRLMLTHAQTQERVMGCRALGEAIYLQALRLYIPNLLKDSSIQVQCAVLEAIGATRSEEYYPWLLRGLQFKPTREAAKKALVRLENEALPKLVRLADNIHRSDLVRSEALSTIGQIGTLEAIDLLIARVQSSWGNMRRSLLRILLRIPEERGIEALVDRFGRKGIEQLIDQELMFIAQVYAALSDLIPERIRCEETDLLRNALSYLPPDGIERLFLLMKFLYPISAIQAAEFNIQSGSRSMMAQGLEILDNTLDVTSKRAFLALIDRPLMMDKLQSLSDLVPYTPMRPHDRVNHLLDLRHFISDWSLACCFHLANRAQWMLTDDQIRAGLHHPRGAVREAVLSYLQARSPQNLIKVLPYFQHDRDPIVATQAKQLSKAFGLTSMNSNPFPRRPIKVL